MKKDPVIVVRVNISSLRGEVVGVGFKPDNQHYDSPVRKSCILCQTWISEIRGSGRKEPVRPYSDNLVGAEAIVA